MNTDTSIHEISVTGARQLGTKARQQGDPRQDNPYQVTSPATRGTLAAEMAYAWWDGWDTEHACRELEAMADALPAVVPPSLDGNARIDGANFGPVISVSDYGGAPERSANTFIKVESLQHGCSLWIRASAVVGLGSRSGDYAKGTRIWLAGDTDLTGGIPLRDAVEDVLRLLGASS